MRKPKDHVLKGRRLLEHAEKICRAFDARMQFILDADLLPSNQMDDLGRIVGERVVFKSAGATRKR